MLNTHIYAVPFEKNDKRLRILKRHSGWHAISAYAWKFRFPRISEFPTYDTGWQLNKSLAFLSWPNSHAWWLSAHLFQPSGSWSPTPGCRRRRAACVYIIWRYKRYDLRLTFSINLLLEIRTEFRSCQYPCLTWACLSKSVSFFTYEILPITENLHGSGSRKWYAFRIGLICFR